MIVQSCADPATINSFANHPEIRPFVGGSGELDLTVITVKPNLAFFGEHGGFCLAWTAPGTFEVHTMITKPGRGRWAIEAVTEARAQAVARGAEHLWTRVHPEARNVERFTRMVGFTPCGTLETDFGDGPVNYNLFNWRAKCQQQQ